MFCLSALLLTAAAARAADPDFDRDIRPILSDKCFHCHGPDAAQRQAELRLDMRASAVESAIAPGQPETSELIARITSDDPSLRMPPPESKLSLSDDQKELLRRWIAAGAPYTEHWSFHPLPANVPLPEVRDPAWPRQPLDRFVLARLDAEGLAPSPRAAPLRLLRRLTLDLTGLPPTPDEIRQFETAAEHDLDAALADAAERLLASPAFGEHLAVAWLDAARYADSFGYQSDQLNTQWPYRDWVVRAFNDNLPYDQFLTWQLAGDLLENPTRDQILATAFNRMHRLTNEGGSIAEEWLIENAADRIHTMGAAMLGLTIECARCHDHKYDPISQRDYYSLLAFFNSIDENGLYDHTLKVPAPSLLLPSEAEAAALAAAQREMESAEAALTAATKNGEQRFQEWLASNPPPSKGGARGGISTLANTQNSSAATPLENPSPNLSPQGRGTSAPPDLIAHYTFDQPLENIPNVAPGASVAGSAPGVANVPGVRGQAAQFDGDHGAVFPKLFAADRWDPFTLDFWLRDPARNPLPVVVAQATYGTDVGYNGFDLMLENGVLTVRLYRVWPGNAIGVRADQPIAQDEWQHIAVTYDGSSRAAGLRLYLGGRELPTTVLRDRIHKRAGIATYGAGDFILGERFRDRGFRDGQVDELRVFGRALAPLEVKSLDAAVSSEVARRASSLADDEAALREQYFSAVDEESRRLAAVLRTARQKFVEAEEPMHEVSVMGELPEPRPAYVLARGAYDAPKTDANRVARDTFENALLPFPAGAPRNRLGLAQWMTDPNHPLTARVFVNRLWSNFFGRGLVATPENFGRQGTAPTHPELLDWLARDFVDHGWDVKRLCRQIILSAAYQQDSRLRPELRERDPENLLLARGPSRRLSAEQLRDLALAASGLLATGQGGPPVSPYQPGGDLWRETNSMSPAYQQSVGAALHRRSLYSVWKRTAPLPNMMAFDAATREVCVISRSRTNTPLQALVLLNDVQFVEAARGLAALAARDRPDPRDQLTEAFLRVAGRRPEGRELDLLADIYNEQRSLFSDPKLQDAGKFLALGETAADAAIPPADLAALAVACQAILSLDAAVYER